MKLLDELEALAKLATPGKWWIDSHGSAMVAFSEGKGMATVFVTNSEAMGKAKRHKDTGNLSHWHNDNDATFIATANPATILAIAGHVRELEKKNSDLLATQEQFFEQSAFVKKRLIARAEAAEAELARIKAAVLGEMSTEFIYHGGKGAFYAGKVSGWNAFRAEMLRVINGEKGHD